MRLLVILLVLLMPPLALSQSDRLNPQADAIPLLPHIAPVPNPNQPIAFPRPVPTPIGFPQIAHAAGTIFSGTVTGIALRPATQGHAIETVSVTFRVEQAIRGATPGENLTISQWMGMWSSGQRYRVGERVMLFLYPPSKLGLTSLVGGELGRFAVDPVGRVLLNTQHLSAFRTDPLLGGKSRVRVSDLAAAVQRVSEEESQ
jgi:hypothetical protein